jgi:uncharacterized coiled-coil protein SlyX
MNTMNNDWVKPEDHEQCDFLVKRIIKLSLNIKGMSGYTETAFKPDEAHQYIINALNQLEKNKEFENIKKIKSDWAKKKHHLKKMKDFVSHTILLSKAASSELKRLTITSNQKSLHETVESLINKQYQQITDEIKEEKKRRKEELINNKKAKNEAFIKQEYSKKNNSHYVDKLQHNKLQNELNEANQSIVNLNEKLASKENSIDKYLDKISKFVDKLDSLENNNSPLKESLANTTPIQDSSSIIENKQEQELEQEHSEDTWKPFTPRKNKNTNKN